MNWTRSGLDAVSALTQRLLCHSDPEPGSGEESQHIPYPRRKTGTGEKRDCTAGLGGRGTVPFSHWQCPRFSLAYFTILAALACTSFAFDSHNPLTFEERIKAQEAIERIYYNHRIWPKENPSPKPPFEKMMPMTVIEAKVTDYLKKSAALEKFWQRPITAAQLQAEMDRMAKQTKDPETLRELFAALNNDPYLVAVCLTRPILADRLIRNWYAYDTRFHVELKKEAEALKDQLTPANFPYREAKRFRAVKIELGSNAVLKNGILKER